ncbi:universal stress protein [Aestuariicella hydrocarbonica]|uniref:Universal stress protein n=1 Tax=Pseudomaricurvus hydrocarbonicus TaxID=1470433 RepID=A0A9E5JRI7_9GAMM|nr:universal stress protein [Aestuariicella hydrocarbonica]NHO64228.1 universal stress protein [Aestuariicella hydrocarbonica]
MQPQITVLVVIDPSQKNHPALERALLLANRTSDNATAKMVFIVTPFKQPLQQSPTVLCTSEWLKENIHDPLVGTHVEYSVTLGWGSSSNDIIVQAAKELNAALTIAPYYEQQSGNMFSDEKWKLLRESENPVLMASRPSENHSGRMLCTVKIQDEDYAERNQRVLDVASKFSDHFELETHVVNAYEDSMEYPDRSKIASMYSVPNDRIYVKQGEPQDIICDVANDIDADLILISSHRRKGLKGALRGNMIEKIIQRLDRDILMI